MDIDWSVTTWTLLVAGATLAVVVIGVLIGLRLLGSTLRQAKTITTDLQRRAKFALSCEMTMPPGAVKTREERDGGSGDLFTFHEDGKEPIEVRLVVQVRNIGDRAANDVLWSVVGPSGINLQFTDASKRIGAATHDSGTIATWIGEEVDASRGTRLWDLLPRSEPYELAIRFACPRDVLSRGVPIRITADSDDLHHGRVATREGATTRVWVLLSAADPG